MRSSSRQFPAMLVLTIAIVAGCGGSTESKRQALEFNAERAWGSVHEDLVVEFSAAGGAIVSIDSISMVCVYNLNEDETLWVKENVFPNLDRGLCRDDFPVTPYE